MFEGINGRLDQVNNVNSAIIFIKNLRSFRVVRVVLLVSGPVDPGGPSGQGVQGGQGIVVVVMESSLSCSWLSFFICHPCSTFFYLFPLSATHLINWFSSLKCLRN